MENLPTNIVHDITEYNNYEKVFLPDTTDLYLEKLGTIFSKEFMPNEHPIIATDKWEDYLATVRANEIGNLIDGFTLDSKYIEDIHVYFCAAQLKADDRIGHAITVGNVKPEDKDFRDDVFHRLLSTLVCMKAYDMYIYTPEGKIKVTYNHVTKNWDVKNADEEEVEHSGTVG